MSEMRTANETVLDNFRQSSTRVRTARDVSRKVARRFNGRLTDYQVSGRNSLTADDNYDDYYNQQRKFLIAT